MSSPTVHRPLLVGALAFAAALAPVAVGAWLLHESANRRDDERLDRLRTQMQEAIMAENRRYIDYLLGVGLDSTADQTNDRPGSVVTDDQWKGRRTSERWMQRYPHLNSVSWAEPSAPPAQAKIRFLVARHSAGETTRPLLEQDPAWAGAVERADRQETEAIAKEFWTPATTSTDRAVATTAELPGTNGASVMVFVPVRSLEVVAGFAVGELRLRELVAERMAAVAGNQLKWEITGLHPVADRAGGAENMPLTKAPISVEPFLREASVNLTPTAAFWRGSQRQQPFLILACGVPLALGIACVAALQARRRSLLEARVAERTAELRTAHDRLSDALTHERELNAMKTNFISMVTHELRTPLSVVQSSTDILSRYLDRLPENKRSEHFRAICHAVTRITDLSDEVLLFSRFESQRMQIKLVPVALQQFCASLVHEILSATSEKCPITFDGEADLPSGQADERLLRHILVNLLGNAVKYSPDGSPVALRLARRGEQAVFTVTDHGIGIAAHEQARLFNTFHRGSNVEHLPGTGLGLVIVKRCVELHGGTISLHSEEGKGTTVTVEIPAFTQPNTASTP